MPDTISGSLLTSSRLWADGFSEYSTVDVAGDQDWWRIELVAGARYQFDLRAWMGSSLDSYLRLIDASGNVLLTNDDANGSLDAQIRYTASISGTYFLSAQGYGTRVGDYALSATTLGLPPPPPPPVTVSIFPVQSSQTEGDAGTRAFTFTVTRSSAEGAASVQWAVRHGTTDAADFSGATGGVVSFAAGQTSQTLTLLVAGDRLREVDEAFSVELSAPSGGFLLGTASAAGLIWNDDADIGATLAGAASLAVGSSGTSAIEVGGDQDWWRVDLVAGTRYRFQMASTAGSSLDSYLRLLNAVGAVLTYNDDANGTRHAQIDYTAVRSGAHYLSAQGYSVSSGAYVLSAAAVMPPPPPPLPAMVSIEAVNASQTEGDAGTRAFTFRVTRSHAQGSGSVRWAVGHRMTDAADFSGPTSGVVNFAAGEMSQTLTLLVAGDLRSEGYEDFSVGLGTPVGLVLGETSAAGCIWNDDVDVGETAANAGRLDIEDTALGVIDYNGDQDWWRVDLVRGTTYRFHMSVGAESALDGNLRLLDATGRAISTDDWYTVWPAPNPINPQFTFTAGTTGTYFLSAGGDFGTTGDYVLSSEILPPPPTVDIAATTDRQTEGDAGTRTFTFTVTRSSAQGEGQVGWQVRHGSTDAWDFIGSTLGVVAFAAGETVRTLTLQVAGDREREDNETFSVDLTWSSGLTLGTARATGVVLNDDTDAVAGTLSSTATVAVGGSVSSRIDYSGDQDWWRVSLVAGTTYRFNLTAAAGWPGLDGSLRLMDANGWSVANDAYIDGIPVFQTSPQITYTATRSGTYYLAAQGDTGSTGDYTLSVANETPRVDIAASVASQSEGDAGTKAFTFTVTRSSARAAGSVRWAVRHGTTDAADFSGALAGAVEFSAGQLSRTLTVQVLGDRVQEGNEVFSVVLEAPSGLVLGMATAQATIGNDDDDVGASMASAARLPVGGAMVSSAIDFSGDQDWWRVDLVAGATYRFTLRTGAGALLDGALQLRGVASQWLVSGNDPFGSGADILWTASTTGTHALVAQAANAMSGAYTLSAEVVASPPTVGLVATSLRVDEGTGSGTTPLQFTVARSSATGRGSVNWAVQHVGTDSTDFVGATSGVIDFAEGQTTRVVTLQVAADVRTEAQETFRVQLSGASGMSISPEAASAVGTIVDDDIDSVGQMPGAAALLAVDGMARGSAIQSGTDQDWWQVQLVAGRRYVFSMQAATGSGVDSYLRLLNASGSMLLSNDNTGTSRDAQISWTARTTGVHYLSAQGAGGSVGQYLVRAARTLTGTAAADVFRFATATEGPVDITDFTSGSDRIQVVSRNFGSLPVGTLSSSRLVRGANPVAAGTGAVFLYDTSTGQLTWDSNGALAGGTSVIANLGAGRSLVAGDIRVVAA